MPAFPTRKLYVRALTNEGTAKAGGYGKPSKSSKSPKQAVPVSADAAPAVPTLPVDPEGGVAEALEPTSQERLALDPVVPAEPTWFESDWLANLVDVKDGRE